MYPRGAPPPMGVRIVKRRPDNPELRNVALDPPSDSLDVRQWQDNRVRLLASRL